MSRVFLLNWLVAVFLAVYQIPVVQAAKIYKCQDENGHMTFSQSPCSASADIVEIQNREPTLEEMQAAHSVHQQNLQQLSAIERAKQEQEQRVRERAEAMQAEINARRQRADNEELKKLSNPYVSPKDIGPCMGGCASEQGICIGQCQGNGQCIGNCAAAHGRCSSRCTM